MYVCFMFNFKGIVSAEWKLEESDFAKTMNVACTLLDIMYLFTGLCKIQDAIKEETVIIFTRSKWN